jgi:hypothetical protein
MRSKRNPTNKSKSANSFKKNVKTTKMANIAPPPTRGGYRL